MQNTQNLKIPIGTEATVTLRFDQPKTGFNDSGEWRLYGVTHNGIEKSFFASEKAHEVMIHHKKGDILNIKHKSIDDGRSVYEVRQIHGVSTPSVKKSNDTDLSIKWGMAFNNSSRLVANIMDITPKQKVLLIKEIMPEMFEIACSMPDNQTKEDENDLPF